MSTGSTRSSEPGGSVVSVTLGSAPLWVHSSSGRSRRTAGHRVDRLEGRARSVGPTAATTRAADIELRPPDSTGDPDDHRASPAYSGRSGALRPASSGVRPA